MRNYLYLLNLLFSVFLLCFLFCVLVFRICSFFPLWLVVVVLWFLVAIFVRVFCSRVLVACFGCSPFTANFGVMC